MEASPISLYLQLEEGKFADLEVAAKASIAFAKAIRDAAYVLDPSLEVRVELLSGTEGSLSINSLIKSIREADLISRKRLMAVSILAVAWFCEHTGDKLFDVIWAYITGSPESQQLSEDDKREIADLVIQGLQKKVAEPHVQAVYGTLSQDTSITGVGATTQAGKKPAHIVPREEFAGRSGDVIITENSDKRRERREAETVTLVSPVLKAGSRRWKFSGKGGEFGAVIKDAQFLDDFLAGKFAIPMAAGVVMDVVVRTVEEKRGDVWCVLEKEVLEVRRIKPSPLQQGLSLPLPGPNTKSD